MNIKSSEPVIFIKTRKIDLERRLDKVEEEKVAVEAPIQLFLNRKHLTTIMASPSNLGDLALGFLVGEGILTSHKDILDMRIANNEIWVESKEVNQERFRSIGGGGVIVTSCSSRADFYTVIGQLEKKPLAKNYRVKAADIFEMVRESTGKSAIFRSTGGVHSASIYVDSVLIGFAEDVGRHNAVDRAIGICLGKDVPLERAILVTSGRQTADIIMKAARCRVPMSVSMRAPLSSGIHAAQLTGVTLVSFVRGSRMNVYSHPERIDPL